MKQWLRVLVLALALQGCVSRSVRAQEIATGGTVRFAEVSAEGGRGATHQSITLFYVSNPPVIWARRFPRSGGGPEWASSETCPAVFDAARTLADISLPQLAFAFVPSHALQDEEVVVTADGPTFTFWAQGLFSNGAYMSPLELQIQGGRELPQAEWLSSTDLLLGRCWRSEGPE